MDSKPDHPTANPHPDADPGRALSNWSTDPGWLNTASSGLPPDVAYEALTRAQETWRRGRTDMDGFHAAGERARATFGRIVGAPAETIMAGNTTSGLLAPFAAGLPVGGRLVVPEVEFTSNLFPWLVQEARGVEVVTVPPAKLVDAIDERTTAVAFSLVQSADGSIAAEADIVAAARAYGASVYVDGTQACGWLPLDATRYDLFVVSAYKWLMAPRGTAYGYVAPELAARTLPHAANWYAGAADGDPYYGPPLRLTDTARRFDTSPAWFCQVGADPALDLVERIGVEHIHAHDVALANRFLAGLGLPLGDSAIVAIDIPDAKERLEAADIRFSARAGRTRLAFHVYNTDADVDAAVTALTS
ncbi:aminotransferase class V-fold PLP-dependent enzyme [Embleya sp. NBC_00888]|uniref:aminotransferase class V-fold PLP-dependent enzyme n=1 Tax=Embleya sp. NBC_00888 TaxID=2975960 RepID=UPI00386A5E0B|nr:aminotransferase class V-fold PLP-dependent enzyme [Embleya sp. NBC_00888]